MYLISILSKFVYFFVLPSLLHLMITLFSFCFFYFILVTHKAAYSAKVAMASHSSMVNTSAAKLEAWIQSPVAIPCFCSLSGD